MTAHFYVDTESKAYRAWQQTTGADKDVLAAIALTPAAYWVGNWADAEHAAAEVRDYTGRAAAAGDDAILAVYAIPGRDNGDWSAGGVAEGEYEQFVDAVASAIAGPAWIILEPDALPQMGDAPGQGDRAGMLRYAVSSLSTAADARVYLDAGNLMWLEPAEAARRISLIGTGGLAGFALNVSNYLPTDETIAYGQKISALLDGLPFVVDTSRNGNGSNGQWCNPRGRAIGETPRVVDDVDGVDALLWIKPPGESDGECNGGPAAGEWWQEIALEMARNATAG